MARVQPYLMSLSRQERDDLLVLDLKFLRERAQSMSLSGKPASFGTLCLKKGQKRNHPHGQLLLSLSQRFNGRGEAAS